MLKRLMFLFIITLVLSSPLRAQTITTEEITSHLGGTKLKIVISTGRGHLNKKNIVFVNVHDDENIAVDAALNVMKKLGGKLVEIRTEQTGRYLSFPVDPNRIFSDGGIEDHLFVSKVRSFADAFLDCIGTPGGIIAVHNNKYRPKTRMGLTMEECFRGNPGAIGDIYHAPCRKGREYEKSDFFLVTERPLFEEIKKKYFYNVVLQDTEKVRDDGSLSVYYAKRGIPYINVEVLDYPGYYWENTKRQMEMIYLASDVMSTYLTRSAGKKK